MSLKLDITDYPELRSKELTIAIENYKDGKRNSKRRLRKFVNREISEHYYNELIEKYSFSHRVNRAKRDKEIKNELYGVASFLILLGSMANTLAYVLEQHGKGMAVVYFFLWFWAINYASSSEKRG